MKRRVRQLAAMAAEMDVGAEAGALFTALHEKRFAHIGYFSSEQIARRALIAAQALSDKRWFIVVTITTEYSDSDDLSAAVVPLDSVHTLHEGSPGNHAVGHAARRRQISGGGIMKSLIHAVAIAVVLSAPMVSFAQSSAQPINGAQSAQPVQAAGATQSGNQQAANSGYGSGSHGSWQAGNAGDSSTASSYSPPVRNIR